MARDIHAGMRPDSDDESLCVAEHIPPIPMASQHRQVPHGGLRLRLALSLFAFAAMGMSAAALIGGAHGLPPALAWTGALLLAGAAAWLAARVLIAPLASLRARMHSLEQDPFRVATPARYDTVEIGALGEAFDRVMRDRLEEEARHQSAEAELRAAMDGSLDALLILHAERRGGEEAADFRVRYANAAAARLLGVPQSALLGHGLCAVLPGLRDEEWLRRCRRVAAGGFPWNGDVMPTSLSVHAGWLHVQAVAVGPGVAVTLRDISAAKRDEAEIRNGRLFLQSLIDYLPVLVFAKSFRHDQYDQVVVWNKAAESVMGYGADQVIGRSNREIFPPAVAAQLDEFDQQMLADPRVRVIPEIPYRQPSGNLVWLRSISVPLFGAGGQVEYILGIVEDITARRRQDLELRTRQAELMAANDASPLGLFRTDAAGQVTYVNRMFEMIAGAPMRAMLGHAWRDTIHPADRDAAVAAWNTALASRRHYQATFRFRHGSGRTVWAAVKAAPIVVDDTLTGYAGSLDDITGRFEAEQALHGSEQRLRTITDNLPVLIAFVDAEQRYRFCNRNYERFACGAIGGPLGRTMRDVLGDETWRQSEPHIAAALGGERIRFERSFGEGGTASHWLVEYIPESALDGKVTGFYIMAFEITERRHAEDRLRYLVQRDALTGLPNRRRFDEAFRDALARSERDGTPLALMFLDIDHFKDINDTAGHQGGDEVLREFARRLTCCVREEDLVARLAGDEFVILVCGRAVERIGEIADAIVGAMREEFPLPHAKRRVSASIGVALRRAGESDAQAILRRADEALYQAKDAGRNTWRILA